MVAAANKDLQKSAGLPDGLRMDLYYRLSVVPLRVPSLRERIDDLPRLVQHFARRTAEESGRPAPALTQDALDRLMAHDWPGNIRELAHAVERAVILSATETLTPE